MIWTDEPVIRGIAVIVGTGILNFIIIYFLSSLREIEKRLDSLEKREN